MPSHAGCRAGTGQNTDFAQNKSSFGLARGSRVKQVLGEIDDKGNQLLLKLIPCARQRQRDARSNVEFAANGDRA
jgi:hypothetical protein